MLNWKRQFIAYWYGPVHNMNLIPCQQKWYLTRRFIKVCYWKTYRNRFWQCLLFTNKFIKHLAKQKRDQIIFININGGNVWRWLKIIFKYEHGVLPALKLAIELETQTTFRRIWRIINSRSHVWGDRSSLASKTNRFNLESQPSCMGQSLHLLL